ncbi:ATPase family AAA domain-containing protein At1g05910 isoform X3 [Cucurbita pepo subsp. pepo]|uniref:ATPase family AAA domain-containing protein At1g05910 isoform X3 n=1 Tax=Cucurbita pepo subsp. pepo TaxID=3664 RepID=UPI000C9DA15F|nr:ATPase family AAA domain-containing protein At1g05910 isoform X3 [Cucurbita pepo subsp. pepo]
MYPKQTGLGDGPVSSPLRTSARPRRRPISYGRPYVYYGPSASFKPNKKRTPATRIAKMLRPKKQSLPTTNAVVRTELYPQPVENLRRSQRQKRGRPNFSRYSDSEDEDLMSPKYKTSRSRRISNSNKNVFSSPKHTKNKENRPTPRREGLRPRHSRLISRERLNSESDDEQGSSEDKASQDEIENGNDIEDNDVEDIQNDDDGDPEPEDEGEEDGDDEGGEEEQEVRRRYDLRNRPDARRLSIGEGKPRPTSPRRVLHQGMGTKVGRDVRRGGSRVHKRRMSRIEDSDDSLLVDELDQAPGIPWARGGSRSGPPWLFGGLDMHGTASWGLNIAASGWGHQSDAFSSLSSGIQTAGPSSKGGADIQPVQVDENVSFDDIGGLSGYIDALKEMVFFPLLYPDFFASYHITPPRGVLLCGPPGTGKTLIARALACAASKAGQKVSFYMRKGADVLSKWVGEAERQLKLLFEEAQRNQPSIIFFDEIDGLAPVRSSKQEQIHNSIVSTLLALMDGLDSRGQVVLIGATNRIDAIDGALRRPGRFDREFNFPLPGCDARAEILAIHTRKWKNPPSEELRSELAATCVGYCGADLKALCTEAAIQAFRQKYPQVYTSDDKFLIDVESVKVEKYHFVEAMSTITPAAHRGAVVHSRPLSSVVAPCLQRHLHKAMNILSDAFPLAASSEFAKLSMLSFGSAIPLVFRPRLLLCGGEGVGLDHLGPAILHELEKFPVHSLGLPSLLSDPSAKTPEEALVHIFGEARRTTPSILYLPQFHCWWETADEQLRAVLLTLLEELPSDLPILLLGTSLVSLAEVDEKASMIFPDRVIYQVSPPSSEDKSLFFTHLIEAASSVLLEGMEKKVQVSGSLPELPKAPVVASGPKASELRAKVEAEQHALRRLRMCLRDVCNRILYDKRFTVFHYPVLDEEAPNYRSVVQNPMDMATLLQHVDAGQYITCSAFVQDVDLIVSNAKAYNGNDYNGARIVSRAYELRDAVHGMLTQMDPALIAFCDKIAAQGGPLNMPEELGGTMFPSTPVVQLGTATRASARLRNVHPDLDFNRSYEALKRPKKNVDAAHHAEEKPPLRQDSVAPKPSPDIEMNEVSLESSKICPDGGNQCEGSGREVPDFTDWNGSQDAAGVSDGYIARQVESVKNVLVERSGKYGIPQLERLYTRIMKAVFKIKDKEEEGMDDPKHSILKFLLKFAEDESNF